MAWTQSDIDTLKAAMAQGVKRVRYVSGEVEYQTFAEMQQLLAKMEREAHPENAAPRRTVGRFVNGF